MTAAQRDGGPGARVADTHRRFIRARSDNERRVTYYELYRAIVAARMVRP